MGVQNFASIVPGAHIASILRNTLMGGILDKINSDINGLDLGAFYEAMHKEFALNLKFFGYELHVLTMILYVIIMIFVCFLINFVLYKRTSKH